MTKIEKFKEWGGQRGTGLNLGVSFGERLDTHSADDHAGVIKKEDKESKLLEEADFEWKKSDPHLELPLIVPQKYRMIAFKDLKFSAGFIPVTRKFINYLQNQSMSNKFHDMFSEFTNEINSMKKNTIQNKDFT